VLAIGEQELLVKLLAVLRAGGVKHFSHGELTVELDLEHGSVVTHADPTFPAEEKETENQRKDREARLKAEEDALLFASAGGN